MSPNQPTLFNIDPQKYIEVRTLVYLRVNYKHLEILNGSEKLIELLNKAEKLASEISGGCNAQFSSAEEFYINLKESIYKLKLDDKTQLEFNVV